MEKQAILSYSADDGGDLSKRFPLTMGAFVTLHDAPGGRDRRSLAIDTCSSCLSYFR